MNVILKDEYDVIIIGGGISGCICASRIKNKSILIVDANEKLMKKIYSTGNGRCNLTNKFLDISTYNCDDKNLLENIYNEFDNNSFIDYLKELGLYTVEINGLYYPNNLCASSVVDAIKNGLKNTDIFLNYEVKKIDDEFIYIDNRKIRYKNLILAAGSSASNINKINGYAYSFLDIELQKLYPSLCGLKSDKKYFKKLNGVRANTKATLLVDGEVIAKEIGQTQFKSDGISGIQIFQFSSKVNKIIGKNNIEVSLDYIYNLDYNDVKKTLSSQKDLLNGLGLIINPKLAEVIFYLATRKSDEREQKVDRLMKLLKGHTIKISGIDDLSNAQVVSGGYLLSNLDKNLKVHKKNIYIIGELVNVDGICGGYNIQWAYSSASKVAKAINDKNK